MNHFYIRADLVERPRTVHGRLSYAWVQGYSRVVDGHTTLPYCTRAEARLSAKMEGVAAKLFNNLEDAARAEREHKASGIFIRYDVWCLCYWSHEAQGYTHDHPAYDLRLCIERAPLVSFGLNTPQPIRVVHPTQWVLNSWVAAYNGKLLGKPGKICSCAVHHGPLTAMKRPEASCDCYGKLGAYDFYKPGSSIVAIETSGRGP